jgi:hypothetical protein
MGCFGIENDPNRTWLMQLPSIQRTSILTSGSKSYELMA